MARALVILPTHSYRADDFVDAAAALGVEVAIASEEEPPLTEEGRFVRIDCDRPEQSADALADLASRTPIDAIVPADDAGVVIAAMAAERIGLRHNPSDAAAATRDKVEMRRRLAAAEVPQPPFRTLHPGGDAGALAEELGPPVVIKPSSLSAGRGVIRADDPDAAREAADRVRRIVSGGGRPHETLLVEAFVPGSEVAVEGMLWSGELEVLAVFDKPDPLDGPFFEETILVTPSRHDQATLAEIERTANQAATGLGLREGPIHAEMRVHEGRVSVLEVAARTIGGLCGRSLRFGLLGTPLEVLVLRHALGMRKQSLHRESGATGVMMLPIPHTGVLREVRGRDEALAVPGVTDLEISIPVGGRVVALPEGDRYLGFLFARGATPAEVERALRRGHAALSFRIE